MKLQIISDLHIDFNTSDSKDPLDYVTPLADILIMAGDIGSLYKFDQLSQFIRDVSKLYKHILYVVGNHEYYKVKNIVPKTFFELTQLLYDLEKKIPNFHFLQRKSIQISNICIIGCTLWSRISFILPKHIVKIHGLNTEIYNSFNQKDVQYIKQMIGYCQQNDLKLIVITHHCPTTKLNPDIDSPLSDLYYNDLDYLLTAKQVDTWIFGHTHIQVNTVSKEGTKLIANQKGKPKENIMDYRKDFVLNF